MFEDEARVGRISDPRRARGPPRGGARVAARIVREYSYAGSVAKFSFETVRSNCHLAACRVIGPFSQNKIVPFCFESKLRNRTVDGRGQGFRALDFTR